MMSDIRVCCKMGESIELQILISVTVLHKYINDIRSNGNEPVLAFINVSSLTLDHENRRVE